MALDPEAFKQAVNDDVVDRVSSSLTAVEQPLAEALAGAETGFLLAMQLVKSRVLAFVEGGGDQSELEGFALGVYAEELGKSVSSSLVKVLTETWAPELADALATTIGERVDEYIRSAEIRVPAGQAVEVTLTGAERGSGATTEQSDPATIA